MKSSTKGVHFGSPACLSTMVRSVLPPSLGEHAPIVASAASAIPVNNALRIHPLPLRLGDVSGTLRSHAPANARPDRTRGVKGKRVAVRVETGCRRLIKQ